MKDYGMILSVERRLTVLGTQLMSRGANVSRDDMEDRGDPSKYLDGINSMTMFDLLEYLAVKYYELGSYSKVAEEIDNLEIGDAFKDVLKGTVSRLF